MVVAQGCERSVLALPTPYPAAWQRYLQGIVALLLPLIWDCCVVKIHQAEIPGWPLRVVIDPIYFSNRPLQRSSLAI